MKDIKNKKSQLVFEPKLSRRLLKMNGEMKFCPFCGKALTENCGCHKNLVIDVKPYRNEEGVIEPNRSVLVFDNNVAFQAAYNQLIEEAKAKKESEVVEEPEQFAFDVD